MVRIWLLGIRESAQSLVSIWALQPSASAKCVVCMPSCLPISTSLCCLELSKASALPYDLMIYSFEILILLCSIKVYLYLYNGVKQNYKLKCIWLLNISLFFNFISCEYTLVYWWLIDFPVQMYVFSANVFLDQLILVNVQSGGALKPSHVRVYSTQFW